MQVKQIINQSFTAGTTVSNPVSLMSYGGVAGAIGTVTAQFDEGAGAAGEITLQGRLSPESSWENLTTDGAGPIQVVAACAQYRVSVTVGVTTTKKCWIGA